MTVFTLIRHRSLQIPSVSSRRVLPISFVDFNKKGFLTIAILGIIGGVIAAYLASMYWAFNLRISIRDDSRIIQVLTEKYARDVFSFEERSIRVKEEIELSLNLEKISSIKYLDTNSITAYLPR